MTYVLITEVNEVYQEIIGESFTEHWSDEIVALFDDEQDAKDYVRKARLKKPVRGSFSSTKLFHKKSLLWNASGVRVKEYSNLDYPINPTL
jgi:hypothetical protein